MLTHIAFVVIISLLVGVVAAWLRHSEGVSAQQVIHRGGAAVGAALLIGAAYLALFKP
ncbi:hypothetical protein ACIRBX_25370 [Kitasatospora sp. NPDC096147]|uniref:hypothetical protein n=1 Tax=Kitasatospora sp. NPDC096147 TaxID=3364093 RepID=UPI0038208516